MNLAGKSTVITGGSRGLGRDIARLVHAAGGDVTVCAKSSEAAISNQSTERWYSRWSAFDLADAAELSSFADSLVESGKPIDILINNAGYGGSLSTLADTTEEELAEHVALNFVSPFLLTRRLLPMLLAAKHGWVVNVASQAGKRGVPKLAAYSATKFALVGMGQALAKELQDTSVTCVTICPGGMNTSMREDLFGDAGKQQTTMSVATIIRDIITGVIPLSTGAEVLIKDGRIQRIELSPNY